MQFFLFYIKIPSLVRFLQSIKLLDDKSVGMYELEREHMYYVYSVEKEKEINWKWLFKQWKWHTVFHSERERKLSGIPGFYCCIFYFLILCFVLFSLFGFFLFTFSPTSCLTIENDCPFRGKNKYMPFECKLRPKKHSAKQKVECKGVNEINHFGTR